MGKYVRNRRFRLGDRQLNWENKITHILHHRLVAKIEAEKAHYLVVWALPTSLY